MFSVINKFLLKLAVVMVLVSCGNEGDNSGDNVTDSVDTDTIPNPTYNPAVETDSGAKQMNLDSTNLNDSGRAKAP